MKNTFLVYDPEHEPRRCPLCSDENFVEISNYSLPPWRVVACVECKFVYLQNPVPYTSLVEEHAWEKNYQKESKRRAKSRPVFDHLSKSTRWRLRLFSRNKSDRFLRVFRRGKVLDVGCGDGTSLPEPLIPFGVEISKELAHRANIVMSARGGKCVHADAIGGVRNFPNSSFNGVLLHSFLEHEVNPLPLLAEVRRVLRDDGSVYVRVPNYGSLNRFVTGSKWCGFRYPDHVNYFTVHSLREMAYQAGFATSVINRVTLPLDDNIKSILTPIRSKTPKNT